MSKKGNPSKPNQQQRQAQSRKDKAQNAQGRRRARGANQPGSTNTMTAAPVAAQRVRVNPPKARNGMSANGNRTVKFEEYVQDIITNASVIGAFEAVRFPVQPGISTLFAWLADQAVNYQEYRFTKLSFRYETDSTTATAGKVMFAFSPDAADPLPATKQEMLEYGIKGKSAVWQEFVLPIPLVEALGTRRYIRSGTLAANLDIKTYDLGALFVAYTGVPSISTNLGELYVEYEVELITPVVIASAAALARSLTYTATAGVAEATPFGTAATITGGLDIVGGATGAGLLVNRVGVFLVELELVGTALNTVYAPTGTVSLTEGGAASTLAGSVVQVPGISNAAANAGTEARVAFIVTVIRRGVFFNPVLAPQGTTITGTIARVALYSA